MQRVFKKLFQFGNYLWSIGREREGSQLKGISRNGAYFIATGKKWSKSGRDPDICQDIQGGHLVVQALWMHVTNTVPGYVIPQYYIRGEHFAEQGGNREGLGGEGSQVLRM